MSLADPMLSALAASGPHPDLADRLRLFGQFVGSWDVEVTAYPLDQPPVHGEAEWHFGWALEGRAIADVWIYPRRSQRGEHAPPVEYGATLRFYDPSIDAWRSTWIGPGRGLVLPFIGRQIGDEIVLEGRFDAGKVTRWIFSKITPTNFRWRAVVSTDDGETWRLAQEMRARRASA